MSRRDTIIVAVLINAGLLIILFVSALKNNDDSSPASYTEQSQYALNSESKNDSKAVIGDEVDQVLSQYAKQIPIPATVELEKGDGTQSVPHLEVVAKEQPPQQNFVDDLTAFAAVPAPTEVQPKNIDPAANYIDIIVKKGDVLEKIAKQHKTSVAQIMKLNKLSNSSLKIGQVLKIPAQGENSQSEDRATQSSSVGSEVKYYIVKAGDNPWTIAVKNHIKVEDLLRLNSMDEARARKLKPGDKIRIR